jgi:hypothetical protein
VVLYKSFPQYDRSLPTFQIATTVEELLVWLKLCRGDRPIEALLLSKAKLLHSTFLVIEKMLIKVVGTEFVV